MRFSAHRRVLLIFDTHTQNTRGYKKILIKYKIHSFYFHICRNYYACIGGYAGKATARKEMPPVPTPKVHVAAAVSYGAAAVCDCRHLAIFEGVSSFRRARPIRRGRPSSLGLLPLSLLCLSRSFSRGPFRLSAQGAFHVWRSSGAVFAASRPCAAASRAFAAPCRFARRRNASVRRALTVSPYNESYFLLETYLPFCLFSSVMLFLKSTKHPYFVKKSLDLIFQRD